MSRPTPPAYKTRNWPDYNAALKRRGSLSIWFDPAMAWEAAPTGIHCPATVCRQTVRGAARGAAAIIPPRKNAKPWKPDTAWAISRNEALRALKRFGRTIWRRWSGYHRRSRVEI